MREGESCRENSLLNPCRCSWNFSLPINKTPGLLDIMGTDHIPISPFDGKGSSTG